MRRYVRLYDPNLTLTLTQTLIPKLTPALPATQVMRVQKREMEESTLTLTLTLQILMLTLTLILGNGEKTGSA